MEERVRIVAYSKRKDIIILMETHEHEGCRVPEFEGYSKISVWNEETSTGKGHEGITILIRDGWSGIVKVAKVDPNKQFIWLNIGDNKVTFILATCCISPQNS